MRRVNAKFYRVAFVAVVVAIAMLSGNSFGQTKPSTSRPSAKYVKTGNAVLDAAPPGTRGVIHIDMKELLKATDKVWAMIEKLTQADNITIPVKKEDVVALGDKISTIDIYVMQVMNRPMPAAIIHGKVKMQDVKDMILKSGQMTEDMFASEGNGRYTVGGMVGVVDGSEADDFDDDMMLIGAGGGELVATGIGKKLNNGISTKLAELAPKIDAKAPIWAIYMQEMPAMPPASAPAEGQKPEKIYVSVAAAISPMSSTPSTVSISCPNADVMKMIVAQTEAAAQASAEINDFYKKTVSDTEMTLTATMDDAYIEKVLKTIFAARLKFKRQVSASHLHSIGRAIMIYKGDFGGQMPANLLVLVEKGCSSHLGLLSPVSGRNPPMTPDERASFKSDYVYLPVTATDADLVVVYEPVSLNKGEGGNVLFADGNAKWLTADEHAQAIKKTLEWMKANGVAIPAEATSQPASEPAKPAPAATSAPAK